MREKSVKNFIIVLIGTFLLSVMMDHSVLAGSSTEALIPVSQTYQTDSSNQSGTFSYRLTAVSANSPMPVGAAGTTYDWTMNQNQKLNIKIPVSHGGVYKYEMQQMINNKINGYDYDRVVYEIAVYAGNQSDGSISCETTITVKGGKKRPEAIFANKYSSGQAVTTSTSTATTATVSTKVDGTREVSISKDKTGAKGKSENDVAPDRSFSLAKIYEGLLKTGDSFPVWFKLAGSAIALMLILLILWKRKKEKEDQPIV